MKGLKELPPKKGVERLKDPTKACNLIRTQCRRGSGGSSAGEGHVAGLTAIVLIDVCELLSLMSPGRIPYKSPMPIKGASVGPL